MVTKVSEILHTLTYLHTSTC